MAVSTRIVFAGLVSKDLVSEDLVSEDLVSVGTIADGWTAAGTGDVKPLAIASPSLSRCASPLTPSSGTFPSCSSSTSVIGSRDSGRKEYEHSTPKPFKSSNIESPVAVSRYVLIFSVLP